MKLFILIIFIFAAQIIFPQSRFQDSLHKAPFDTNKIKTPSLLSNSAEVFSYDSLYIWSDKRNLSEIMNERSGYFVNNFGLADRNIINYNGYDLKNIGIYRDGIQINDILFGGFDVQNFTVNEIDRIEEISNVSSFLYGINTSGKSLNIITKDVFKSKPFSQFRYSQDRFNSLYADVVFNLPLSRKVNIMTGITNQSGDGRYQNSGYNIWRGRGRLSYYASPDFNIKLNFYYDNIKRGLNQGLEYSQITYNLSESSAEVLNKVSDEQTETFFYDATLTGSFFRNKKSLTKLFIYSSNNLRNYFNDSSASGNILFSSPSADYHYIQYAVNLNQSINSRLSRYASLDFYFGVNSYLNFYNYKEYDLNNLYDKEFAFIFKTDLNYRNLYLSVFASENIFSNDSTVSGFNAGVEGNVKLKVNKHDYLKFFAGINSTDKKNQPVVNRNIINYEYNNPDVYAEAGVEFSVNDKFKINTYYFYNKNVIAGNTDLFFSNGGINTTAAFYSKYVNASLGYDYLKSDFYPESSIKSNICFHHLLFNNKLNLKTGFDIKYFSYPSADYFYSQGIYNFTTIQPQHLSDGFQIDYYLGARIGHANVNLTVANIFNTFYYDTYLYPADNLGGFLNAISRFTIVWDFLN
jgi:hypothetical protein